MMHFEEIKNRTHTSDLEITILTVLSGAPSSWLAKNSVGSCSTFTVKKIQFYIMRSLNSFHRHFTGTTWQLKLGCFHIQMSNNKTLHSIRGIKRSNIKCCVTSDMSPSRLSDQCHTSGISFSQIDVHMCLPFLHTTY